MMIGIMILLEKLGEALKDEFSEFGRSVGEQKQIEKQSEPVPQTLENKSEAEVQPSAAAPETKEEVGSTVERVTPKQLTKQTSKAVAL